MPQGIHYYLLIDARLKPSSVLTAVNAKILLAVQKGKKQGKNEKGEIRKTCVIFAQCVYIGALHCCTPSGMPLAQSHSCDQIPQNEHQSKVNHAGN